MYHRHDTADKIATLGQHLHRRTYQWGTTGSHRQQLLWTTPTFLSQVVFERIDGHLTGTDADGRWRHQRRMKKRSTAEGGIWTRLQQDHRRSGRRKLRHRRPRATDGTRLGRASWDFGITSPAEADRVLEVRRSSSAEDERNDLTRQRANRLRGAAHRARFGREGMKSVKTEDPSGSRSSRTTNNGLMPKMRCTCRRLGLLRRRMIVPTA